MRMAIGKSLSLALTVMMLLGGMFAFSSPTVKAAGTEIRVVNPQTGNSTFSFNTSSTQVGQIFVVNVTVVNVVDLATWQIKLSWNASLLSFVNVSLPPDHVFAASGKSMITPTPSLEPGNVTWGCPEVN